MIIKIVKLGSLFLLLILSINASAAPDLIIMNAQIINPTEKLEPRKGYIIIHNGRIKKVSYGQLKITKNARVYDAKYQYLIPGLIDSHNHIDTILGLDDQQDTSHSNLITDYRKQLPRSYLYFGYTTIIDLVSTDQNAIHTFNANPIHPDLYTCGGGMMAANGYPMNDFPEKLRFTMFPNFLYESNQNTKLPNYIDPMEHIPSAIIKRIVNANGICVKVFYESGFGTNKNLPLPSLSAIKEIVRLAHQYHLPALIHANSLTAQKFVLETDADIFAHGLWNWGTDDGHSGLPLPIQDILDQIINKHLGYQPTMQVIHGLDALVDPNFLNDPQLPNVVPKSLLVWYRTKEGQWYANLMVRNLSRSVVKKRLQLRESQIRRVVSYLQRNHGNLLFGTDTPSGPTYGNPPGYNGYLEMKNWYRAGVPLSQILIAATIRNAEFFHLENNYGSISAGKIANLIIMKKNPLNDISAYDSITSVILHGRVYDRPEFLANKK